MNDVAQAVGAADQSCVQIATSTVERRAFLQHIGDFRLCLRRSGPRPRCDPARFEEAASMPLVFISHAHDDALLARAVCALLRDSLELSQADFFVSSVEGRGVAPAASIQQEVLSALASAPALIVVMTPRSALSRWVWLEVGSRLGQPAKPDPLIVCPAERFATLLGPIGDRKAVNL